MSTSEIGIIRTDTCGSSSSARRTILHKEAGYIYADCLIAQLQTSCGRAADHTLSPAASYDALLLRPLSRAVSARLAVGAPTVE